MEAANSRYLSLLLLLSLTLPVLTLPAYGQRGTDTYEFSARPDLWYNDVDGIQIGTRISGRMAGTAHDGPHRIDAAVRLGTWFPDLPVSYSLIYTEPVPSLSEFESEFHLQLLSSVEQGYHRHGLSFSKRWQEPFDYREYWEASIGYFLEKRFDSEYTLFPSFWSSRWKGLIHPEIRHRHQNRAGPFSLDLSSRFNTLDSFFYTVAFSVSQQIRLGGEWRFHLRAYAERAGENAAPEYLLTRSSGPAIGRLGNRVTRAKGTIPVPWARSGHFHYAGGANLRGYTRADIRSAVNGNPILFHTIGALNMEFDLPNPVQTVIRNTRYLSEILSFRTYLFTDAASVAERQTPPDNADIPMETEFADAGAGVAFSLNIPDHLGRSRGFVIRYEVPFWLSDPESGTAWKWRHLLGFGVTISF